MGEVSAGDPPQVGVEEDSRQDEEGISISPTIRKSMRKSSVRRLSARRVSIAGPKSPMMRMAEMRRGGLRGRDLRQSEVNGKDGFELQAVKRSSGRAKKGRSTISENKIVVFDQGYEGMNDLEKGNMGKLGEQGEEANDKQVQMKGMINLGNLNDCALDSIEAQPLQEMCFVAEQVITAESDKVGIPVKDSVMLEVSPQMGNEGYIEEETASVIFGESRLD